ncbi:MAG TPA: hypothetical protein VMQ17_08800 [Candidatus Sulfotelmatobacter sp.]|nr:hypothetical protein [Candidatus Sulfotelmatobacter sp.]
MSTPAIDYDAIARQHGGTAAAVVDYDALAAQHGGTAQAQPPAQPKSLGSDMFGSIPDNLYTRIGARIKENLDIPKQIAGASDAISAGIQRIKDGGWEDAFNFISKKDSQLPAFRQALRDEFSKPENVIGDALSAYILGQGHEAMRGSTADLVDQHIPPEGSTYRRNLETKAAIEQHLESGNVDKAQAVLDAARRASEPVPPKASAQYRSATQIRPSIERIMPDQPAAAPPAAAPAVAAPTPEATAPPATEAPKPEVNQTPPTESEEAYSSPYKNKTPAQWKKFDERLTKILDEIRSEPPKEAAPAVPVEQDLTPQLLDSLRQIQARKAFLDQNAAH